MTVEGKIKKKRWRRKERAKRKRKNGEDNRETKTEINRSSLRSWRHVAVSQWMQGGLVKNYFRFDKKKKFRLMVMFASEKDKCFDFIFVSLVFCFLFVLYILSVYYISSFFLSLILDFFLFVFNSYFSLLFCFLICFYFPFLFNFCLPHFSFNLFFFYHILLPLFSYFCLWYLLQQMSNTFFADSWWQIIFPFSSY